MGVNIGLVGIASIAKDNTQVVTAPSNEAIRVFDLVATNTACTVALYSGTNSSTATFVIGVDVNGKQINSAVGYRFVGGVYASVTTAAGSAALTNFATITYMKEF